MSLGEPSPNKLLPSELFRRAWLVRARRDTVPEIQKRRSLSPNLFVLTDLEALAMLEESTLVRKHELCGRRERETEPHGFEEQSSARW
jgi:hypothetical protein